MIGYTPAEQAIRAARGEPDATGADNPPACHDQPDAAPGDQDDRRDFSLQQLHEGIAGLIARRGVKA